MPKLNPYLNFDGQAEEALNFYKSVFGGEFLGEIQVDDQLYREAIAARFILS